MNSPEINELAAALVAAQAEFSAVPKGSTNPFFKSKYAALPEVMAHLSPILTKHGLAISQHITYDENGSDQLLTYLLHKSGQFIAYSARLHLGKDDTSQALGSSVSYLRRYSILAVCGAVSDDSDDDGNSATQSQLKSAVSRPAFTKSAPSAPVDSSDAPPDIADIIKAANMSPDNEFLASLAQQWASKGSLSEKQIASGKKIAYGVLKNSDTRAAMVDVLTSTFDALEETF